MEFGKGTVSCEMSHWTRSSQLYHRRSSLSCLFSDELLCLHRGQGLDMHWRDSFTCPTEDECIEMARGSERNKIVFVTPLT